MNNFEELEVKILNIDIKKSEAKLKQMGAKCMGSVVQKIYTYDCYSPILMYNLALKDYEITKSKNSLQKIVNIYSFIEPVITDEEKIIINGITGYDSISEYISKNINNIEESVLNDSNIIEIIRNSEKRFFKWIRLRENGEKVELTIKYIYNVSTEYNIDDVKEIEIIVDSFEVANKLVEEMGYFRKKLVEKKRTSYKYNNVDIEIDEWPLIHPYIEIEGKDKKAIYNMVQELGFDIEEAKVMNTEDVYLGEGKDLNKYEVLTFNEQIHI